MDSCILKIRRDLGIGSELKVFVDACLERLYVAGKTVEGREFQSLEDVIGINELANTFVRLISTFSEWGC